MHAHSPARLVTQSSPTPTIERRLLILQETFADVGSLDMEAVLDRARNGAAALFDHGAIHLLSAEAPVPMPWVRRGRFVHADLGTAIRAWFAGPPCAFWLLLTCSDCDDEMEFRLGTLFLELLCSACQGAGFRAEFEHQARTDWLTGLPNRRAFERAAAAPESGTLWLGLFDLDDLKEVNDTRGHAAGDALLVAFSSILRELVTHDRAFRTGGDEFAVLATEIERKNLQAVLGASSLHASAGWDAPSFAPLHERAKRADARMYANKRRSKGRRAAGAPDDAHSDVTPR